jgi:hypothetical protein
LRPLARATKRVAEWLQQFSNLSEPLGQSDVSTFALHWATLLPLVLDLERALLDLGLCPGHPPVTGDPGKMRAAQIVLEIVLVLRDGEAHFGRANDCALAYQPAVTSYGELGRRLAAAANILESGAGNQNRGTRKSKRRRRELKVLTVGEAQAVHLVSEHKGNYSQAGAAAGKPRQLISKQYKNAMKKLGKSALPKPRTQRLPTDQRGQETVTDGDR